MSVAVFTFGRFNPPTTGHMALVDKVKSVAKQNRGKPFVFTGQSTDPKKNPLNFKVKTSYMKKAFSGVTVVTDSSIRTAFDALAFFDKKKVKEVIMVVGSDRVPEFRKLINKYLKDYNFESFKVVSAGERDPDATGVKGMSASKMRDAAKRGDYDAFRLGCPQTLSKTDCLKLFKDVQKGMGINENIEEGWFNHDDFVEFVELNERKIGLDVRRKMARSAKRTAKRRARTRKRKEKFRKSGDTLQQIARKKAKGFLRKKIIGDKDWASMSLAQRAAIDARLDKKTKSIDKIAKKLLPKVKVAERERLQKLKTKTPGQPPNTNESLLGEVKIVDRLVQQLKDKGMDNDKAHAVARSQLQRHGVLKKGSEELTDKGKKRNSMSPGERAKDRAAKKDGKSPESYKYNKTTNIATQKEEHMLSESDEKPLLRWMEKFETELKKVGSSYKKIDPVDALKLYYKGVDPKKAAPMLKSGKLEEAYTPKQKDAIAKVKQVLFRDNKIGFYTALGKIMVSGKDEKRAKEVLDKAFGGDFTKSTGMTVKKSIGPKRDFKINAGYESIEEKMTFTFGTKEQAAKFATMAVDKKLASVTDRFTSNFGDHMVELSGPHSAGAGSPTMAHKNLAKLMKRHGGKLHSTNEGPRIKKMFKEEVELNEKRPPYAFEPDARIKRGIESGKFPMVASKLSVLGGNSVFGVFQFTGKAAGGGPEPGEKQGSGYVDGYVMAIVSNPKRKGSLKIFAYYGSHPDPKGAIAGFAKGHNLLSESVELDENAAMINKLRKAYGGISKIDPAQPTYKKLTALLDRLAKDDPKLLKKLAKAKIKFVSSLAMNRVSKLENPEYDERLSKMNIGEMSAKAHYKKFNDLRKRKGIVPGIDRDKYPNREKQGLEGPYRSKKSGQIYYYDRKAGKYYDTDTDMYLQVKDIMDGRDYKQEYANFHGKPEQRAKRSKRVLARREMVKQGRATKGDGKDVDHADGNANNNSPKNLRMMSVAANRSRNNNKNVKEEHGAGDEGTPEALKKYKDFTPGESGKSSVEETPKAKKKKVDPKNTGTEGY